MLAEVQTWAEAEADRTKRHELAEAKAEEGRAQLDEYLWLKEESARLDEKAKEVRGRLESWRPAEEKGDLIAAEDAVREHRRKLTSTATFVVRTLGEALGVEDDNQTARELLADYYWDRYLTAEARFDEDDLHYYGELVGQYHDGKYATELAGDGSLTLTSKPPGAEVWLHDLVEEGFTLVERNERLLGVTPLVETPLALGSYLVILKKEGYRDTRYPVCITRNKAWSGEVNLYTDEDVGPGFIYVPAGPFVMGGDPDSATALPRSEPRVEDFFIAEHPVTCGDYLEFLNDVARARKAWRRRRVDHSGQSPTIRRQPRFSWRTLRRRRSPASTEACPRSMQEGDEWQHAGGRSCRSAGTMRRPTAGGGPIARRHRQVPVADRRRSGRRRRVGVDGRWYPVGMADSTRACATCATRAKSGRRWWSWRSFRETCPCTECVGSLATSRTGRRLRRSRALHMTSV